MFLLLNNTVALDGETKVIFLTSQFVLQELCQRIVSIAQSGNLRDLFTSPQLSNLAASLNDVPKLISVIWKSFLNENLHQFLVNNQLSTLINTFPMGLCGNQELNTYFDLSRVSNLYSALCNLNTSVVEQEFQKEILYSYQVFLGQNMGLNVVTIMNEMVNKAECIYNTSMTAQWERIIDITPLMKLANMTARLDSDQW